MIIDAEDARILSEKLFGASLLTVAIFGTIGLTAKAIEVATTGALTIGLRMIGLGIKTLFTDFKFGMRIIGKAAKMAKEFYSVAELSKLGRLCNVISKICNLLTVVGIIFDVVLATWSLIEGDLQRAALRQGIIDLSVSRISIKMNQLQIHYMSNFQGEVNMYLLMVKNYGKDSPQAQLIGNAIGHSIKKEIDDNITFEKIYHSLKGMDDIRNSFRDEDPTKEKIKEDMEKIEEKEE